MISVAHDVGAEFATLEAPNETGSGVAIFPEGRVSEGEHDDRVRYQRYLCHIPHFRHMLLIDVVGRLRVHDLPFLACQEGIIVSHRAFSTTTATDHRPPEHQATFKGTTRQHRRGSYGYQYHVCIRACSMTRSRDLQLSKCSQTMNMEVLP
jgi:hypothetical protein